MRAKKGFLFGKKMIELSQNAIVISSTSKSKRAEFRLKKIESLKVKCYISPTAK